MELKEIRRDIKNIKLIYHQTGNMNRDNGRIKLC